MTRLYKFGIFAAILLLTSSCTTQLSVSRAVFHGDLLLNKNKFSEAVSKCDKAIEMDSEYIQGYTCRGRAYLGQKRYRDALNDFNYAIELDPNELEVLLFRGYTFYQINEYDDALKDFDKFNRLLESNQIKFHFSNHQISARSIRLRLPSAYYYRGLIYLEREEFDKGIAELKKVISMGGFGEIHCFAHYYLGQGYRFSNRSTKAIDALTHFLDCASSDNVHRDDAEMQLDDLRSCP